MPQQRGSISSGTPPRRRSSVSQRHANASNANTVQASAPRPPSTEPLEGEVTVHILESEKLTPPSNHADTKFKPPTVQLSCGDERYESATAVGSALHMWKAQQKTFSITTPATVEVVLLQQPQDVSLQPVVIGRTQISVEKRNDCGAKWAELHLNDDDEVSGRLKLKWDFQANPPHRDRPRASVVCEPEPTEPADTNMHIEVSLTSTTLGDDPLCISLIHGMQTYKCDGVFPGPDFASPHTITLRGKVEIQVWHPATENEGTTLPPRLCGKAFLQMSADEVAAAVAKGGPVLHKIPLTADGKEGATLGEVGLRLECSVVDAKRKGSRRQSICSEHKDIIDQRRRRSTMNDDGTIALGFAPTRDGSMDFINTDSTYAWNVLLNETKFRKQLEQHIIEGYLADIIKEAQSNPPVRAIRNAANRRSTNDKPKEDLPPCTIDTVVTQTWGYRRYQPVFETVRLCAEEALLNQRREHKKKPLFPLDTTQMLQKRVSLVEQEVVRVKMARESSEVRTALADLWTRITADNRSAEDDSNLEHARYRAVIQSSLTFFLPGISHDLAKTIAEKEWDEFGRHGRDENGAVLLFDERFKLLVMRLACLWCETQTEFEVVRFLENFAQHLVDGVKRLAGRIQRASLTEQSKDAPRRASIANSSAHPASANARRRRSSEAAKPSQRRSSASPARAIRNDTKDTDAYRDHPEGELLGAQEPHSETPFSEATGVSSQRRRSSVSSKRGSLVMSTSIKLSSSRRGSRKKTPFEMAEDCVKKAFEFEDMNWNVLAAWAKEVFGGFGEKALDLLGMSANEVSNLMARLYNESFTSKHHKLQHDLVSAVIAFFREIKPVAEEEKEANKGETLRAELATARSEYKSGVNCSDVGLDRILSYSDVPTLIRCRSLNQYCRDFVGDVLELRLQKCYRLPENLSFLKQLFTEVDCKELALQCSTGKLKTPSKLSQTVAEMACAIIGFESNGYWAKFRELICRPNAYSVFEDFDPATFTRERFVEVLRIKTQSDDGIDRQGRQIPTELIGVSWVTMTETTVAVHGTDELACLYRWVRLVMSYYAKHSGRTPEVMQEYCWMDSVKPQIYWD